MKRQKARWVSCVLFWATAFHANASFATEIEVQAAGCDDLNVKEISRLVDIELSGSVKGGVEKDNLIVRLECYADAVKVVTIDNSTKRSVQREIVPRQLNVQERVVALSISQLILASLEELKATEQATVIAPPNPAPPKAQGEHDQATMRPKPEPARLLTSTDFMLTGGGKLRLKSSLLVGTVGLRGQLIMASTYGIALILEFETGTTSRKPGAVTSMGGFGGLAGFGRFLRRELFHLDTGISASMGYGYLKGRPTVWASGNSAGGWTGEFALLLTPTLTLRRALLALAIKGGYTIENPVGLVANDQDVTIGGFWIGADLCLGLRIRTGT